MYTQNINPIIEYTMQRGKNLSMSTKNIDKAKEKKNIPTMMPPWVENTDASPDISAPVFLLNIYE